MQLCPAPLASRLLSSEVPISIFLSQGLGIVFACPLSFPLLLIQLVLFLGSLCLRIILSSPSSYILNSFLAVSPCFRLLHSLNLVSCICYHFHFLSPSVAFLLSESPQPYYLLLIFLSIFSVPPSMTLPLFVPVCFLQSLYPQWKAFVACVLFVLFLLPLMLRPGKSKHRNHRGDVFWSFTLKLAFRNSKIKLLRKPCSALHWYVLNL